MASCVAGIIEQPHMSKYSPRLQRGTSACSSECTSGICTPAWQASLSSTKLVIKHTDPRRAWTALCSTDKGNI
eukprot:1158580-Pelagomonas_calceolata.AAC.8